MAYETKQKIEVAHNLIMESRERLSITGVEDVESFDEEAIVVYTTQGMLIVRGESLHIEKLSLDGGELVVAGRVHSLRYEEDSKEKGGFLSKLFK